MQFVINSGIQYHAKPMCSDIEMTSETRYAQFTMKRAIVSMMVFFLLAGCAAASPTPTLPGTPRGLPAVVIPTPLAVTPGPAELDPSTGLHVTGKAQVIDLDAYRLEVTGLVEHPLSLTYDDLRCLPKIEVQTTIVCKGNFDDTAVWAGVTIKTILELAGVQPEAKEIILFGADEYVISVDMEHALSGTSFLAYELHGQPVPILHGFPVRAAFPGLPGFYWVKWLFKIEVK